MIRIAFSAALLTTVVLAVAVRAQQTNPDRLGSEDGLLGVTVEGKHGFIDLTGRMVIPPTFDFACQFSEGRASAWRNGRAGFIDRNGEPTSRDPGDLIPQERMGRWGFLTPDGKVAVDFRFDGVQPFSEGLAPCRLENVGDLSIAAASW